MVRRPYVREKSQLRRCILRSFNMGTRWGIACPGTAWFAPPVAQFRSIREHHPPLGGLTHSASAHNRYIMCKRTNNLVRPQVRAFFYANSSHIVTAPGVAFRQCKDNGNRPGLHTLGWKRFLVKLIGWKWSCYTGLENKRLSKLFELGAS